MPSTITFYGGVHEIGGNKFLLEDRGTRIFLDFGMQISKFNQYFAEFVNPRTCNGMNDLFEFGLLPPLRGLYRKDHARHCGFDGNEETEYEDQIARWKSEYGSAIVDLDWLSNNMFVLPVAFAKYHKEMLAHCKEVMEYHNGRIAINPSFNKLIVALHTAVEKGEGTLDKEATSHNDVLDAFRMSLQYWVSN